MAAWYGMCRTRIFLKIKDADVDTKDKNSTENGHEKLSKREEEEEEEHILSKIFQRLSFCKWIWTPAVLYLS